jgi:hypothetical protein
MQLENGNNWDGTALSHVIETGDFSLQNDPWNISLMRRLKVANERVTDGSNPYLGATIFRDVDETSGTSAMNVNLSSGNQRVARTTNDVNEQAWLHRLKFEAETSGASTFRLLGYGYEGRNIRIDR